MGKGQKPNVTKCITLAEEKTLFASGQLGDHDSEDLICTVWYFFTLHLGMRGKDEHTKLKLGDLFSKRKWSFERGTINPDRRDCCLYKQSFQSKNLITDK